jgi:hypothetical protein
VNNEPEKVLHARYVADGLACEPDAEGHCSTCADEALPGIVLSVDQEAGLACVSFGLSEAMVDITLIGEVVPGVTLLVHGGVALERLGGPV